MGRNNEQFDLSKLFARRLITMIETWFLTYKQFEPWADAVIEAYDNPPFWILDLSVTRYSPDAAKVIREYAYSEPFEAFDEGRMSDEAVACLLLRHLRREISWATFLSDAGDLSDGCPHPHQHDCEYFHIMLNDLEDSGYAEEVERRQRDTVQREYSKEVEVVRAAFEAVARWSQVKGCSPAA